MDVRTKILQSRTALFLNHCDPKLIIELFAITDFLPEDSTVSKRYWHIKNQKTSLQTCKCCDKEPHFYTAGKGYSMYCSTDCRKEDTRQRHVIYEQEKLVEYANKLKETPDSFVECKICNKAVKIIKNHLHNSHKDWSIDAYFEQWPDADTISRELSEYYSECSRGDNNSNSRTKTTELERKQRSVFSIESWKLKYPDKSEEELQELLQKSTQEKMKGRVLTNQLQYWIDKGFTEEIAKEKLKERQSTFTLGKCIKKYGEELGTQKWKERQEKWYASFSKVPRSYTSSRFSAKSKKLLNALLEHFPDAKCYSDEIMLMYKTKTHAHYDFTHNKKITEFNGDFWHCNPSKYAPEYFNKIINMTAKQKWESDAEKVKLANDYGYEVLTVWESDYHHDPKETIEKCLDFLNS